MGLAAGGYFFGTWRDSQPNAFMTWEDMETWLRTSGMTDDLYDAWNAWAAAGVPGAIPPSIIGGNGQITTLGEPTVSTGAVVATAAVSVGVIGLIALLT